MNQRAKSFEKLFANLPNDMMASKNPSNSLYPQVLPYLSTEIIKAYYHNLGKNMGDLPELKKQMVAATIVQKWGENIWVTGSDACVPRKFIVL